ncbi:MAG TPA: pyridoxal-dependent decarboxylase, partial [Gemmatimonadales bacterium]|nr:pyridoxal-dependent decarboxylase [Gemmatimonadales bacterium]
MSLPETARPEETLDPENWDELRALGHRMVDEVLTYLQTIRERPVWRPIPDEVKAALRRPLPREGEGAEAAYQDFRQHVLPHPMGNIHPRFWGWVIGTGTPFGALAEMLAAAMNPNMGGGDHVANYVEAQVLDWFKELVGYPADASGLLVSGGSMANLVGLTVARNARAGFDVRTDGVGAAPRRLTMYGSREMHSSVQKGVELLGLGSDALRLIPVDEEFRVDVAALERAIRDDRAAGYQPVCIIGNAGTVMTGAIDDLAALADLAEREGLWYHVDGAFGAIAALDPELRRSLAGMERADSIAFDPHKWLYVPIEVGCILIRNQEVHRRAFSLTPEYLKHAERGVAGGEWWPSDYGIQLTRGFRALKVWLSLKEHGSDKYARLVRQNVEQMRYLAQLVCAAPDLELLAPVPLNIVCFRYRGRGGSDDALNALNAELLMRLHERGIAVPTNASIDGKFALRVANVNHRSRREDF